MVKAYALYVPRETFDMKIAFITICSFCLFGCISNHDRSSVPVDTLYANGQMHDSIATDSVVSEEPYADYFIVIADTGKAYLPLYEKMNFLSTAIPLKVDMMDRSYNKANDLITLPEKYEKDDLYAGKYFPRREQSEFLSLEYMNYYDQTADAKKIALIAGIYANQDEAESLLIKLQEKEPKGFIIVGKIYVGCMH